MVYIGYIDQYRPKVFQVVSSTNWDQWIQESTDNLVSNDQWRKITDFDSTDNYFIDDQGRRLLNFSSNDYLGMSQNPKVIQAGIDATLRWGTGTCASRLINGGRSIHKDLEAELADWKKTESALLFSSGMSANIGILSSLGTKDVCIYSDELNHASIIDGCRLSKAEVKVYAHKDIEDLSLLWDDSKRGIVVTDAVFSMDGDSAPIEELVEFCSQKEAILILDEAHMVFDELVGKISSYNYLLQMGTLSKTVGSVGGFVAGKKNLLDLIMNKARSLIFSTAPTPSSMAAALEAIKIIQSEKGDELKQRLSSYIDIFSPPNHCPIIPIIFKSSTASLQASQFLKQNGYFIPAIRPPSVTEDTSRIRITLSTAHKEQDVRTLKSLVDQLSTI